MVRYKPYGLQEADLKPPYADIIPDRVKRKIDLHHKNHIEYNWDQEDRNEQIFEYRKTLRPNTYSYNIEAIYRIRDPNDKSKEYYFYQKKGKVLNEKDEPEYTNSLTYGYCVEPVHELKYNPKIKQKEPSKIRDNPIYFYEWNPKEVKKLLDGSEIPCNNLYIGLGRSKGQGSLGPVNDVFTVKNKDDWLEGRFDDLLLLNRAGIMSPDHSTLNMIDKARSRFEEEHLRRIAQVSTPSPVIQAEQPQGK